MGVTGQHTAMPCRVAFVGAGYMTREHAKAFAQLDGVTLAGIHSRTRERAETVAREYGIDGVYGSIEELYEETRADLVVVSVPELQARGAVTACASYPWLLMLEKPAGYDLADATAIHAIVTEAGRRAIVALNRRFYASTRAVLADLNGRSGPRFITIQDQEDPAAALAAGQPELVVRNWMFANAIHLVDYFSMFGRGPVLAVERPVPFDFDAPTTTVCTLRFASGDIGLYEGVWNAPGPWGVSITTESRRWEMRPVERAGYQDRGQRSMTMLEGDPADLLCKPGLLTQAQEAVCAANGLPSDSVFLDSALATMQLIERIFIGEAALL